MFSAYNHCSVDSNNDDKDHGHDGCHRGVKTDHEVFEDATLEGEKWR